MSDIANAVTDEKTGFRDYPYPPTGEMLASVTTVRDKTIAKPWIPDWVGRITSEAGVDNIAHLAHLAETEGRDAAVAWLAAEADRRRNVKRDTGGYVHDVARALILWQASPEGRGSDLSLPLLPDHLRGADYDGMPLEDVADFMIEGFLNWVSDWNPAFEAAEMTVYNYPLGYAGTLDIIASLPGIRFTPSGRFGAGPGLRALVDVKTGRDPGPVAEQVAAYRRCTECRPLLTEGLLPMPATDLGAVLHLRPEHRRGYRFIPVGPAEDALGWENFRKSAGLITSRKLEAAKPGKVCRPPRPDGTVPAPYLDELDGEGYGQVLSRLIKAGYDDLEQVAAVTAGQLLRTKGIKDKTVENIRAMLADHGLHLAGEAPDLKAAAA